MSNLKPLKVSADGRFLIHTDGTPFFYLADTGWCLFHRLNFADASHYLETRAAQGFTVIQAVVLAEHGGLDYPNANGDFALQNKNPDTPNEKYLQHVDAIVNRAQELGLWIGMLPTWGDKWNKAWGEGPEIFTPESARRWGQMLGKRYKTKPIIWILGGDRNIENDNHRAIITAMAQGLKEGDGGAHLQTFHPSGGRGSAEWFQDALWLDFNMRQTGHGRLSDNYRPINDDYNRTPHKPILDAEPGYEDHPADFNLDNGRLEAYDTRRFEYQSLFAGACGYTYGCHDMWQFYEPNRSEPHRKTINSALIPWRDAILLPGATQMQHARHLLESRPFLSRIPDQSLIVGDAGKKLDHVQATRDQNGSYTFIYLASGREIEVDTSKLSGESLRAWWFDPRNGNATKIGEMKRENRMKFTPPIVARGSDWVLVLDDAAKNYPAPGARFASR